MKNRRPQGFYWFLLSVLFVLSAITPSRAQTPPDPGSSTVITNSDDLMQITNGGSFTFATNGTYSVSNVIVIKTNTIIDATGLNVVLSGNFVSRVFTISSPATLTLLNVQITAGKNSQGAAIYNNNGTLIASNVTFASNRATNAAGANGANGSSGSTDGQNGGGGAQGLGGAIYSSKGYLILTNCVFTNNLAAGGNGGNGGNGYNGLGGSGGNGGDGGVAQGGAIYSSGTNLISGCYFAGNGAFGGSGGAGGQAGTGGGATGAGGQGNTAAAAAIYIPAGGVANLTNCSFYANVAIGGDSGPQSISAAGFSQNGKNGGPALGGVIENFGTVYTENCTFFTNSVHGGAGGATLGDPNANAGAGGYAMGGAICNYAGTFTARNCTFATNNAIGGTNGVSPYSNRNGATGAVEGGNLARYAGTLKIANCILQHGSGPDAWGAIADGGYNLSSDTSCAFTSTNSISKTNVFLVESLVSYPGFVAPVLPFKAESKARDFIRPEPADDPTNFPATDEVGQVRFSPDDVNGDAGAFEFSRTAPIITLQPQSQFVTIGTNVKFTVSATGSDPLAYQWYFIATNGLITTNHFGTNDIDASITITNVQSTNFGTYFVVITNTLGSATSSNAVLALATPASITSQSGPVTVNLYGTATFSVSATGGPLTYQWYSGSTALANDVTNHIVGATSATLTINNATAKDAASYHVVVSSTVGAAQQSAPASLTVLDPGITSQPASVTVNYGARATFTVGYVSSTNVTFVWRHGTNNAIIANATTATYTNLSATTNDQYFVVLSNKFGGSSAVITSAVATLTVNNPAVTISPTNLVVDVGSNVVFTASAAGSATLHYQWQYNGSNMPNQTNVSLTISSVTNSNAGTYTVFVSNSVGVATSPAAVLAVRGTSSISGQIFAFGTNAILGSILVTNGTTNVTSSAYNGVYLFGNLTAGTYTITPQQLGSGVTPTNATVVVDGFNPVTNINFRFNAPHLLITAPPTNNIVALQVLSAPLQTHGLEYSSDLLYWARPFNFTADTNGISAIAVTNSTAASSFFIRVGSPAVDQPPPP